MRQPRTVLHRTPKAGQRLAGFTITRAVRIGRAWEVTLSSGRVLRVWVERPPEAPGWDAGGGIHVKGDGPPVTPLAQPEDHYGG